MARNFYLYNNGVGFFDACTPWSVCRIRELISPINSNFVVRWMAAFVNSCRFLSLIVWIFATMWFASVTRSEIVKNDPLKLVYGINLKHHKRPNEKIARGIRNLSDVWGVLQTGSEVCYCLHVHTFLFAYVRAIFPAFEICIWVIFDIANSCA